MKNSLHFTSKKGFTLIELLVVIAIIGLLSTLAIVSLNNARVKARDSSRLSDMKQIRTALELYYDKNNQYPPNPGSLALCTTCIEGAENNSNWSDVIVFLNILPKDPTRSGTTNGYRYIISNTNGRQSYTMLVRLEKNSSWCSISVLPGHSSWISSYPSCF